ncbi:diacylglycerol kinase family protein [Staphylococcus felis]|uniref:Diacylglycerol kinase family protein n=1 Tax=Staphylococcus felis TaxID=46127 RepID=A0A2K3ZGC3_9STAP|nr:diacylglycerol kinase family protein [Staphylococcus felis]AVP37171.1 diacylglycerol kinase [Staphylococcus felis]MBH9581182.1 diacylglycerol kinase family protein [Staphylococcus felis]MDM8327963.1 diacylglycerol kinase family protein [Staphylococcus felis]MDQ7192425.1 diacylglycerol kinase family protein [Staphylococcus felis]PNZ36900.1 diacylglycerol kinase [Staphylococcus felis]
MKRFKYAFEGGKILLKKDPNFTYHLICGLVVLILAIIFQVNQFEWLFLILATFLVWTTEAINTAIEFTVDLVTDKYHPLAKYAKDIAAFSVLISSVFAIIVACIIFIPKII